MTEKKKENYGIAEEQSMEKCGQYEPENVTEE